MPDLLELIKIAALDAVDQSKPAEVIFGTVTSTAPLSIYIDQKWTIAEEFLILTHNVVDYNVEMTVDHTTETAEGHSHGYTGKKVFTVHKALEPGDRVILLRVQSGQRYLVLDKVVN